MDSLSAYEHASTTAERIVARVGHDQFGAPTPCTDWTVGGLLNHLVGTLRVLSARLTEQEPVVRARPGGLPEDDLLGDDHVAAYATAASALAAVIGVPGALERDYPTPVGPLPGSLLAETAVLDLVVHGWDLATSTGQDARIDDALARHVLDFATGFVREPMRGRVFAAAVAVPAVDASAADRLLGFLGRDPLTID